MGKNVAGDFYRLGLMNYGDLAGNYLGVPAPDEVYDPVHPFDEPPGPPIKVPRAGVTPNADALGSVSQASNGGVPAPRQPYAMSAGAPTTAPVTAAGALSSLGALVKGTSSDKFTPAATAEAPTATTAPQNASDWLANNKGQFMSAMGMISTHFAQTPGQLAAGQMISKAGASEMDQQRKDKAAQELGYSSSQALEAAGKAAEVELTKSQGVTEQAKPGLMESEAERNKAIAKHQTESIKLISPEIDRIVATVKHLGLEGDKIKQDLYNNEMTTLINPLGNGQNMEVKKGELAQFYSKSLPDYQASMQKLKQLGIETDSLEQLKGQTIKFGGLDIPATMLNMVMPGLTAQITASAHIQGERIAAASRLAVANATKQSQIGKMDEAAFTGVRTSMMDFQKHFSDPMSSAMLFTKDAKGNMVIKPEAKPQAEQYAATAGVLLQSPHPVDKQRAAGILNNLLDVKGISRADYDMLMKGVPFTASYGGAVPAAVPAAVPSPIPSNQVTPTSSVSGSSALSRYSLGPPEIYKGSAATEDVIGAVAGFPSAALRRLRKDFYAGPANQ